MSERNRDMKEIERMDRCLPLFSVSIDMSPFNTVGKSGELIRYFNWWLFALQDDGLINEFNELARKEWALLEAHNTNWRKEFIWVGFLGRWSRWVRRPNSYFKKIYAPRAFSCPVRPLKLC